MPSEEHQAREADSATSQAAPRMPAWAALYPASVIALGGSEQPVERLLTLQSAIAKAVHLAIVVGQLRPKLRHSGLPSLRFR